jgi:hypothetical protein
MGDPAGARGAVSGRIPWGPYPRARRGGDPGTGWRGRTSGLLSARGHVICVVLAPLARLVEAWGQQPLS